MPLSDEKYTVSIPRPLITAAKVLAAFTIFVFLLSLIITPASSAPVTSASPIKVSIEGSSTLSVPANRAILSLRISSSGSSQSKVADEVRLATEEVLGLLRPHTAAAHIKHLEVDNSDGKVLTPVADLSVNTFSSQARKRPGLLGEKDVFEGHVTISATFQSTSTADDPSTSTPSYSVPGFDTLSILLARFTKLTEVRVESLKWTIDDTTERHSLAQVRTDAMQEAVDKVGAYSKPLLGCNVIIRATRFTEGWRGRNTQDFILVDMPDDDNVVHLDELGDGGVRRQGEKVEMIGLEPQTLKLRAEVEGDFEVWVPIGEAARQGGMFGWLRWCYVEFSALGAKVVLRR